MKVVHLTSVHARNDTRIFRKECCSLSSYGFSVSLIVADGMGNDSDSGIKVTDVGKPKGRLDRVLRVTNLIYKVALSEDAAIYHIHDPELLLVGYRLKKKGKIVIFDAHEDVTKQILSKPYLSKVSRLIVSSLYAVFEKVICKNIDFVVAATPYIRRKFYRMGIDSVDINNYPLLNEFVITDSSWSSKKTQVCYVGGLTRVRGIKEIVLAVEKARNDIDLVIGGDFSEDEFKTEILSLVKDSKTKYKGWLDRKGVNEVLHSSIAGLVTLHPIPNYLDALPVKMFEYMAAGIPVIASNFPLWKEIIDSNECGYCVDPFDVDEIASKIDSLARSPDLAKRMGENGQRAVVEKYNWNIEEKKLILLYSDLTS
ncbi:glycosyltransferase family 4 protein [Reinekea forsetii]|nr:glycosyltransferase family 4 protein [Reinekea forsetii]